MFPPSHLKVSCFQGTNCQPWWKGWWPSASWEKDSGQGWFEWVWNSLDKIKSWKMSVLKRTSCVRSKNSNHIVTTAPPHHWGRPPPRIYTTPTSLGKTPLKFIQQPHHWGRPPEYRKLLTLNKPKPTYSFVSYRPPTFDTRSLLSPRSHLELLSLLCAPA